MSITIDGIAAEQLGLIVLRTTQRPGLPASRDNTLVIPGRNGAMDFGADMEPRYFKIECAFIEKSPEELQEAVEALARLLVDSYGKPRTVELIFAVHPDRTYTVRYSGSLEIDRLFRAGSFSLPLTAFEPYSLGLSVVQETNLTNSPQSVTVHSSGDIRTEPVIMLTNMGSTGISTFVITNEYRLEG